MSDFFLVRRAAIAAIAVVATIAGPRAAAAQSTVDPVALEFRASTDHDATNGSGAPVLSQYEAQFFLPGAAQPFQTVSLGKPTPDGNGMIRIDFASLSSRPSPGIVSDARVAALGPGGATASNASGPFQFSPPPAPPPPTTCTYPLSPATQSVPSAGGLASVTVNAGAGCTWSATSSDTWLRITSGAGTGFGSVLATAEPNVSATARTATLHVNGQHVTVTQPGVTTTTCTYTVSPSAPTLGAAETPGSLAVDTAAGCAWSATTSASWITIVASTGSGAGWVSYRVTANTATTPRTGAIIVAGQSITVTQNGAPGAPPACTVTVQTTSVFLQPVGGSGSVSVSASSSCQWQATSSADWLMITAVTGSGDGWVSYGAGANDTGQQRSASITVAGRTIRVTQARSARPGSTPSAPGRVRVMTP